MGLWKIDTVSREGWHQQQLRRHRIISILEAVGLIAFAVGMWFLFQWAADVMRP